MIIFWPISLLYRALTTFRNLLYDRAIIRAYRATIPVISVGNLTVGGSGKTPLVVYLMHKLSKEGRTPVCVMRGYRGSERGPYLLRGTENAKRVGDEALLVRKKTGGLVVVAAEKWRGVQYVEKEKLGDVVIVDDGFQHRRLARDYDILLLSCGDEGSLDSILKDRLLPYGRLREGRAQAFRRAKSFVLSHRSDKVFGQVKLQELRKLLPTDKVCSELFYRIGEARSAGGTTILAPPCDVVLCSAIAAPGAFFRSAESAGFKVVGQVFYRDHFRLDSTHICALKSRFPGVPILCTEKDLVKIETPIDDLYALEIDVVLNDFELSVK